MAWTNFQLFLALTMVVSGSINTLSTKFADRSKSKGSDGEIRPFNHPFLQAACMFMGEMLCLVAFKTMQWKTRATGVNNIFTQGNQRFKTLILWPAALFDLVGTSTMYIGLTLTYASSFQMLRGSIIVFVALLSVIILHRKLKKREWCGIVLVILGLLIVGISDFVFTVPTESHGPNSIITGDLLIIAAQIISACQMVYEEKYISGLDIPALQAAGWEGVFGFCTLVVLLIPLNFIPAPSHFDNNARGTIEDPIDGLVQMGNNGFLLLSMIMMIVSIAFFNFAGISMTKEMSATTRMVLDSVRTLVIWTVTLGLGWQVFHVVQLLGFVILMFGACVYNKLLPQSFMPSSPNNATQDPMQAEIINREADNLDNEV